MEGFPAFGIGTAGGGGGVFGLRGVGGGKEVRGEGGEEGFGAGEGDAALFFEEGGDGAEGFEGFGAPAGAGQGVYHGVKSDKYGVGIRRRR